MNPNAVIGDYVSGMAGSTGYEDASLVLSDCFIGVEAELEHAYGVDEYRGHLLERVSEGSLHQDGVEFIFSYPLKGDLITTALKELEELYKPCPPTTGNNTSLHVHVDVRDLTFKQLWKFIMLYTMFEVPLFKYSSPDRMDNIFCVSSKDARIKVRRYNELLRFVKKGDFNNFLRHADVSGRYSSMNVQSVAKFGSLEFRGHKGEWQKEPILKWVNLLMGLKKAALDDTISWERPYLALKERGTLDFAADVFGDHVRLLYRTSLRKDVQEGCQLARSMVNYNALRKSLVLKGCRNNKAKSLKGKFAKDTPKDVPVPLTARALDLPETRTPYPMPINWNIAMPIGVRTGRLAGLVATSFILDDTQDGDNT